MSEGRRDVLDLCQGTLVARKKNGPHVRLECLDECSSTLFSVFGNIVENGAMVSSSPEGYGGINEIPMLRVWFGLKAAESKLVSSGAMCGRIIFGGDPRACPPAARSN